MSEEKQAVFHVLRFMEWGNSMITFNPIEGDKRRVSILSFSKIRVAVGDYLCAQTEDGNYGMFRIEALEYKDNPPDLFEATVYYMDKEEVDAIREPAQAAIDAKQKEPFNMGPAQGGSDNGTVDPS